ncbi:hypothetical protein D9M71_618660 [compost metagenome]
MIWLVDSPEAKISLPASASESPWACSGPSRPLEIALDLSRSRSRPVPSSLTRSSKRSADSWISSSSRRPVDSLPVRLRTSGFSRPWSMALRSRWVSTTRSSSRMRLSTCRLAPFTSRSTRLPAWLARSWTMAGKPSTRALPDSSRTRCNSSLRLPDSCSSPCARWLPALARRLALKCRRSSCSRLQSR